MFNQDPSNKSKLMGVTVSNSDEHMWKHISGRKFLNVLEEKETGKITSNGGKEMKDLKEVETKKGQRKVPKANSEPEELDFWMPPPGSRWDFYNGPGF